MTAGGGAEVATAPARRRVPRQARSWARVDRILATARQILAECGPEALNTNRIAKEAGVAVGSVYEYFPDKHAIAMALLDDLSEQETTRIMARFGELAVAPLPELVRAIVELSVTLYREHHSLYRSLWSMTSVVRRVGDRPPEKLIVMTVVERLRPYAEALGIDDLDLAGVTVFHLVESLAVRLVVQENVSPEACVRQITRAVLGYLNLPRQT